MHSLLASGPAAAEVPNRYRVGSDVVHHPVTADAQTPSVRRSIGNDPAGRGSSASPGYRVEHLTDPVGVVTEEPGRLVNRLGLPDDLTAHPARPSSRSASWCGTY